MKLDQYGCLVMEGSQFPANIGDSCAETSRSYHLKWWLGQSRGRYNLAAFFTPDGMVRHPKAPDGWRESDFSSDQALPLYLAPVIDMRVYEIIKKNKWRTGNGNFVSPIFFALLINSLWLCNFSLLIQLLLFKLPFRWSDSKKALESSAGSTSDYLNFIHASIHASAFVRWFISADVLISKVESYYKDEPNVEWLLSDYRQVIRRFWK